MFLMRGNYFSAYHDNSSNSFYWKTYTLEIAWMQMQHCETLWHSTSFAEAGQPNFVATETKCSRFQWPANSWCERCSSHDEGADPLKSAAWQKSVVWVLYSFCFFKIIFDHFFLFRIGELDRWRSIMERWLETRLNQQRAVIWPDSVTKLS